ncbi:ubiquitin fusion degradation protein [Pseudozyma hubeiensis SY62]|uniref:Ubiquitin fusion degradation protein n=1 Tax=Pseudozyma hubeiensis (strain SY62) TaxID=1305764 RepID=R9NWT6_PSEHS|nr:ubiquitin fusion degradation protein [Pseudozyma hubeiensis SY62]GAC92952.1 ubiquitin fusion degradation protein [Pseudozyma hubeiensis SY62]
MYCALILTGLLATSSNWYGQSSNMDPLMLANTSTPASTSPSDTSTTRSSYGWLELGLSGGRGFFSPLSRPSTDADTADSAAHTNTAKTEPDFYRLSIPWSESQVQIPKRFFVGVGKHRGLGVWIDLGSSKEDFQPSPTAAQASSSPSSSATNMHV